MAARARLERAPPGSEPGMVPVPPSRIASEREDSNLQPPVPETGALTIAPRPVGTDDRSRTCTDRGLSATPLPVGLRQRGPGRSRTDNLLLAGELRYQLRHRPSGRGSGNRTRVQGV